MIWLNHDNKHSYFQTINCFTSTWKKHSYFFKQIYTSLFKISILCLAIRLYFDAKLTTQVQKNRRMSARLKSIISFEHHFHSVNQVITASLTAVKCDIFGRFSYFTIYTAVLKIKRSPTVTILQMFCNYLYIQLFTIIINFESFLNDISH